MKKRHVHILTALSILFVLTLSTLACELLGQPPPVVVVVTPASQDQDKPPRLPAQTRPAGSPGEPTKSGVPTVDSGKKPSVPATDKPSKEPPPTSKPGVQQQTVTLQSLPAEDGYVYGVNNGEGVSASGAVLAGDGPQNKQLQAFLSFDISGIPHGATIKKATLDLGNHSVVGTPFAALGTLRAFRDNFDTLDNGDFVLKLPPTGFAEWNASPGTAEVTTIIQELANSGAMRFQVRLQFEKRSDNDNATDWVSFPEGSPALTITYAP